LNLHEDKFWQKGVKMQNNFFSIFPSSQKYQKNFTPIYFDAIENLEKVTQVQWKSLSSLFYNLHPHVLHKKY